MNTDDIINEVIDKYGEWLEMSENPEQMIIEILAGKVYALRKHLEYLGAKND